MGCKLTFVVDKTCTAIASIDVPDLDTDKGKILAQWISSQHNDLTCSVVENDTTQSGVLVRICDTANDRSIQFETSNRDSAINLKILLEAFTGFTVWIFNNKTVQAPSEKPDITKERHL